MITEERFTAAMEQAVELRGAGWKYPKHEYAPPGYYVGGYNCPTYSDHQGNGTCLIGVAMKMLGLHLPGPTHSPSAFSVLIGHVPDKVIMAARCAQVHQDQRHTWGESLKVYKIALEAVTPDLTMYDSDWLYRKAVARLRGVAVDEVTTSISKVAVSLKEISEAFTTVGATAGKVTFSFGTATNAPTITGLASGGIVSWSGAPVVYVSDQPTKAEHALIA